MVKQVLLIASILVPLTTTVAAQTVLEKANQQQAKQRELQLIQEQLEQANRRQRELKREIKSLKSDVGAINRALVETAKHGQELETEVQRAEATLAAISKAQAQIRRSLAKKSALLTEVLAALQRMGRKPPPALLVRPQDALASVRSAIILGAVVPDVRDASETLYAELTALAETTREFELQREALTTKLNALAEDETRLALLIEEKKKLSTGNAARLEQEKLKSVRFANQATSLKQLIGTLETQIASSARAARAASDADSRRQLAELQRLEKAREQWGSGPKPKSTLTDLDPTRIEPAIAFSKSKQQLLPPVSGILAYKYGAPTGGGTPRKGIGLATRANARVRAPADSWVVYAGPFRSYGQLVILNTGEGYHLVLAGLSEHNVEPGQFVLAGEPIGRMGIGRTSSAGNVDLSSKKPVLSVELRKDGKSIDPSPWWVPGAIASGTSGQISSDG